MTDTDPSDSTMIDRDTTLIGLAATGVRLYADPRVAPTDSTLAAERAVFARQFDPIWSAMTNDDQRWLREKLDDEDGAFGHMVADHESRAKGVQVAAPSALGSTETVI